jgi:hypothetical protein
MGDGLDVADLLNLWSIDDPPVVHPAQDNSHPAATPPDPGSLWLDQQEAIDDPADAHFALPHRLDMRGV